MKVDTTPTVDAIEQIEITGNVIPPSWYQAIKTDTGKTALLAINILSDIVYWYRPTIRRDEETGQVASKTKKFKSDKLQKSYGQYADFFGVPKDTVTDAVSLLVDRGLIEREFRTINPTGTPLNNVMFLEPVPSRIADITFRTTTPMGEKPDRVSDKKTPTLPHKKWDTYTETTTETKVLDDDKALAAISKIYQSEIGVITPMIADALRDAVTTYPPEWITEAIQIAVGRNARNWKYVETVLKNAKQAGKSPNLQSGFAKPHIPQTAPKGKAATALDLLRQG